MQPFKIRCSQIGNIIAEPKNGNIISVGAMSYCDNWIKEQLFNKKKIVTTKYMSKGTIEENNAIDFIAQELGYGLLFKNKERFENDYMTGTPDILPVNSIDLIEIKSCWDYTTFPLLANKIPNKDHYWQSQGYMGLPTKRDRTRLIYVLLDTPEHLIESEVRKYCYMNDFDNLNFEIYQMIEKNMTYKDVPNKYKLKQFIIDKNEKEIQKVESTVINCREYIHQQLRDLVLA